jgi:predicted ArsR family transcriptional regulator
MTPCETRRGILKTLSEASFDVYDLADALRLHPNAVCREMAELREEDLIDWMYPEDEAALSPAGRAALEEKQG